MRGITSFELDSRGVNEDFESKVRGRTDNFTEDKKFEESLVKL